MSIRWRLSVLLVQLVLLVFATYLTTGNWVAREGWFFFGLLAVVVNPQLLEPYYSRPQDVVANSIAVLFAFSVIEPGVAAPGWRGFAILAALAMLLSLLALVLGAGRSTGRCVGVANAARRISQCATSRVIYSSAFALSALDYDSEVGTRFWTLIGFWAGIMIVGLVDWERVWLSSAGHTANAKVLGTIGPSSLLVSVSSAPAVGSTVLLKEKTSSARGVVISRIYRPGDVWVHIHVSDTRLCEAALRAGRLDVQATESIEDCLGYADVGSTDGILRFTAISPLEVGSVVQVPLEGECILYQITSGIIDRTEVVGGSHLTVRATATQLGIFDTGSLRFRRHRWVPPPGTSVLRADDSLGDEPELPSGRLKLGVVIGTKIPILLDCSAACEGHLAILGMTKMGKSTLAERIARELARTRHVTILDQTGEYVAKKGLPKTDMDVDWKRPGISVYEPQPGEVPPKRAEEFLQYVVKQAVEEYKEGKTVLRSVIIDEAHQFIPEPAGLGFNAPGRDSAFAIGLLMMQIRKYGISVVLISQRTAVVAKSALSQCENLIAFRSVDQTGLDYLEAAAGGEVRNLVTQLRQGEALVYGPAISSDAAVAIEVALPKETPADVPPANVDSD